MKPTLILSFLFFFFQLTKSDNFVINKNLLNGRWTSFWITCPDVPQKEYGVYHFRKSFELPVKPDSFVVHVTADNRYRLFVNGIPVCSGPARGDLYNWYFETLDIAPYLKSGKNVIAAQVWNMGEHAPVAQITNQTGFVLQGNSSKEYLVNTNKTWKVLHNVSYTPCSTDNSERLKCYMVVGPGEQIDASLYPWGWEDLNYDDSQWKPARNIVNPVPFGHGTDNMWTLVPRNIPLMYEEIQRIPVIRRSNGIEIATDFFSVKQNLVIPANQTISILLDQTYNTVAYPEIVLSKGRGALIKLTYAEALFDKDFKKGNRNEIEGKKIIGNDDIFIMNGENERKFRPLWFKTYRYVQLDIITKDEELIVNDFYGMRTGYPFEMEASFTSNDKSLKEIWDVSWRTSLACAGETFFDTPYYEQLQYPGDTRLQALIMLYMSSDDRLMRKAILDFYHSRTPEGLPQGRYPSSRLQIIPTFSLFWVSMIYDYWMHKEDDAFVEQFLPSIRDVLEWHERNIDADTQMLGKMPWWNFVDWVPGLVNIRGGSENNTAVRTLHYSYTLKQVAEIFNYFGRKVEAAYYLDLSERLNKQTYKLCYDVTKGLFADSHEKLTYSQHANIMGVLADAISQEEMSEVVKRTLQDTTLSQTSFFYKFYLTRVLKKVGMEDIYYSQLTPWRDMLDLGLTTFAETPEPTRSDSHAWSSTPLYEFLSTICGIVPAEPGFKTVLIKPALGELKEAKGEMPHPKGKIKVDFKRKSRTGISGDIFLPPGLEGTFIWNSHQISLKEGQNKINLN